MVLRLVKVRQRFNSFAVRLDDFFSGRWPVLTVEIHRLQASSTVYLVVRDWSGTVTTDPCRVIYRPSVVRSLRSRNGQWGDSIFVGLPSCIEGSPLGVCCC